MSTLMERLAGGEVLIGDGAMGTMLFARGLRPGECPESINLRQPGILTEIAGLYLAAGADILQTNTFGGSPLKLAAYNLADRTEEINRVAVAAVRLAVGDRAFIVASCGPSGRILKPYGDTEPAEVAASFERQARALVEAGVDGIVVETMTDLTEAELAVRAAKAAAPRLPVFATMTFDDLPRGFHTIMGVTIARAAAGLAAAGADGVGSNCGNGSEIMVRIAREFRQATGLPLLMQANAGLPEMRDGAVVYPESPDFMAEKARDLVAAGVSIVGGCCGTTPDHIRAIREAIPPRRDQRQREE